MAYRIGWTANYVQYRDYCEVKLNVTHTQIMVGVAEIVLSFQTLLSTFKEGFVKEGTPLERITTNSCIQEATSQEGKFNVIICITSPAECD